MNVRMGLIWKKPDWTHKRFADHWRTSHGPLVARVCGLREYWQNLVTDRLQRGIEFQRGPWDFDGISQLWFDDKAGADAAFNTGDVAGKLIADEQQFIGKLHILTTEQRVVVPLWEGQARSKWVKRISTLKRLPEMTEEEFRREWVVHAEHVRKMPGVGGYRQNVVVGRELVRGKACAYQDLPIDGVVEFWFEDTDKLNAAFASASGQVTMNHAKTFLQEITAFLVEERRIV